MITEAQIADFAKACEEMRREHFQATAPNMMASGFNHAHVGYKISRKYARLTVPNGGTLDGSAYAFVDMATGDIYLPASWKTPAKHARGNIANGIKGMGPYGPAYLR